MQLMKDKKPLDLKGLIKDIHDLIHNATNDHSQALDYARLVPFMIDQLQSTDLQFKKFLRDSGIDKNELDDIILESSDPETGLKAIEDYMGLNQDNTKKELKALNEDIVKSDEPAKIVEPKKTEIEKELEDSAPVQRINKLQNIAVQVRNKFLNAWKAVAPTMKSDHPFEAQFGLRAQEQGVERVPISETKFFYDVKRKVLEELADQNIDQDSEQLVLGDIEGVYLTAKNVTQVDTGSEIDLTKDPEREGVLLVLTDRYGEPITFDENTLEPTYSGGRIAYYRMRTVKNILKADGTVDESKIQSMISSLSTVAKIPPSQARAQILNEAKQINDIRDHINSDKNENQVRMKINGGSLGYITISHDRTTPLAKVKETLKFEVADERLEAEYGDSKKLRKGDALVTTHDLYGYHIKIERPGVKESQNEALLSDLLTESLLTDTKEPLTYEERRELLRAYIDVSSPEGVKLEKIEGENYNYNLYIEGDLMDLTTPEGKAETKKRLDALVNQVKAGVFMNGKPVYKFKMHINQLSLDQNSVKTADIITNGQGQKIVTTKQENYREFLNKNNFSIQTPDVGSDGKLRRTNAYFTFELTDEAENELYPQATAQEETVIREEIQKRSDEAAVQTKNLDSTTELDVDELLNDTWDDEELFKTVDQKNLNKATAEKRIIEAKNWYENHPLSKHIPFKIMFHKVNSKNPKAVASWAVSGITLYRGSDYTDLYHEAFHGFSQMFLTEDQRSALYDEVRKKSGSFKDYNKKNVVFSKATDKQVEEYLAEEFRSYMLRGSNYKPKGSKQQSFFRRLWDALKVLFGNSSSKEIILDEKADIVIGELFNKLRIGDIAQYSFNVENTQFGSLNQGIRAQQPVEGVDELNYQNSKVITDMIDHFIVEYVDTLNSNLKAPERKKLIALRTETSDKTITQDRRREIKAEIAALEAKGTYKYTGRITKDPKMLLNAYKYAQHRLGELHNSLVDKHEIEENETKKALLYKDIQMLKFAFDHFGDTSSLKANQPKDGQPIKGVISYHMSKSKVFLESEVALDFEELSEEETFTKSLRSYNRAGNESSLKELAKTEIVYLLKTLPKRDQNGNPVTNRFGITELAEFQATWNRITRALQNVQNFDQMYDKLVKEGERYTPVKDLLLRMGDPKLSTSNAEHALWTNFWQTFNKTRIPLIQMTVEQSFDVGGRPKYAARIGEAFNADFAVGRRWQSEFTAAEPGSSKYISRDKEGNFMNTGQILKDFSLTEAVTNPFNFYKSIGFNLTDTPELKKALRDKKYNPRYFHQTIEDLHKTRIRINNLDQITETQTKRFKAIQILEAKNSDLFSNFMVTNAEGNTQFEHTLNNTLTVMVNSINNVQDYNELIMIPHMAHLDIDTNPFAKSSVWLRSMFFLEDEHKNTDQWGKRRTDVNNEPVTLRLTNLSGVLLKSEKDDTGDGIASASADEYTKLIMDLHLAYAGIPELMRHADKSTSFSVTLNGPVIGNTRSDQQYIPVERFGSDAYHRDAMNRLIPHIAAEMRRIQTMKKLSASDLNNYDFKYIEKGQTFSAFDDVLSPNTKKRLTDMIDNGEDFLTVLETDIDLRSEINQDFRNYFQVQYEAVSKTLSEAEFIAENIVNDLKNKGVAPAGAKEVLVRSYVYNNWIHNIESIVLLYGDLAQYDQFSKRNAGIGSTGTIYRTDQTMQDFINQNLLKSSYAYKHAVRLGITEHNRYTGQMKTAIVKDMAVKSVYYDEYVKELGEDKARAYLNQNEADAQGLITFDAYRQLKVAEGTWGSQHESLFRDVVNGKEVSPSSIKKFFPVIKAQYWGPLQTKHLPVSAFHKYSLFPMIPSVIRGKRMEALHNKMVKEGISYLTFESGSKVGTITKDGNVDNLYSENRTLDPGIANLESEDTYFTPNVIHLEYLKNQLEIHDERKGQVIFSTQLRKLVEDGLMANGVPTDFMQGSSVDLKIKSWERLSESEKLKKSKRYNLLRNYEKNIDKLTQFHKQKLLDEIDWTIKTVKGKEVLSGDIANLMNLIKRELTRQDLGQHAIDFIQMDGQGNLKHDLSLSLSVEQIEKLLNALMVKKLVKQKVNGEGLIQVASTLFEGQSDAERNFTNPTENDLAKYGSNDLPTYRKGKGKNGTTSAMKVKIALAGDFIRLLELNHNDGQSIRSIDRLNQMIKNEEWLDTDRHREMITMTGVRIPVQGLNSMEFMEVYEFLPAEAGSVIVPPTEIVTKSGADFDVDKMTVTMPNIRKAKFDRGVKIIEPQMWNWTDKELKDAYEKYVEFKKTVARGKTLDDVTAEDNLIFNIFNMGRDQLEAELLDMLIEEGEILSFDEFKRKQLGDKAIQNDIIGNIRAILELPENFKPLITPNSTDILDPIAKEMKDHVMDFNPLDNVHGAKGKSISPTRILEVKHNLHTHSSNNIGKQTLSLGAVDNTYNTLFNRIGAYMNPTTVPRSEYEAALKVPEKKRTRKQRNTISKFSEQTILLPHNTLMIDGEKAISLSHTHSVDGQNSISDIVNQLINGWVDVAKDAWIFNIQGNKEVSPVLLFMIQAGVPINDVVYFVSNPLVREYVKQQKLAKSVFAGPLGKAPENVNFFRSKARETVILDKRFGFNMTRVTSATIVAKTKDTLKNVKTFDTKDLQSRAKSQVTRKIDETDRAVFLHFLQLEDMSKSVRDVKMRTNVDTSRDVSLFEAQDRLAMLHNLKEDGRMPTMIVDKIRNESPIGSFFIQDFQIALLEDAFPLRNHEVLNRYIQDNLKPEDVQLTYGDKEITVINWKSDLINFIFQNELRYFNIDKISHYKSRELTEALPTEDLILKYGAYIKNDKLYLDKAALKKQYMNKEFSIDKYKKLGLAKINNMAFNHEQEYVQFVLERETLRYTRPLDSLRYSKKFVHTLQNVLEFLNQKKDETSDEFKARAVKSAYEVYLRDAALVNTYNQWHLFQGFDTTAHEFIRLQETYPELAQRFAIMNALSFRGKGGFKNLAVNDSQLNGDQINVLHENLQHLTDPSEIRTVLPEASQQDINEIVEFFERFPVVAFLQSGMNAKSMFALTPFVPQGKMLQLLEEPLKKFHKLLESYDRKKEGPQHAIMYLDAFHRKFRRENSSVNRNKRIRGKHMSVGTTLLDKNSFENLLGESTVDVRDPLFIGEGVSYTAVEINPESVKRYVEENPNSTYVYNFAVENQSNATRGDHLFHGAGPNTVGLPTLLHYSPPAGTNIERPDLIKDKDGQVDPAIKDAIDTAMQELTEAKNSGQVLVFSEQGYGQEMLHKNRSGSMFAPQTFLYLSKQLYENFGYLNPRYLQTRTGTGVVQSTQSITDVQVIEMNNQAVRDFMKQCLS